MALSFLEFEQPIAELEAKIEELGHVGTDSRVNIAEEIARLQKKSRQLTTSIFAALTPLADHAAGAASAASVHARLHPHDLR